MWSKTRFAIFAVMLISLVSLVPSAKANPGVHVAVPQSPLSIGKPVYITFYSDVLSQNGAGIVYIGKGYGSSETWNSGWKTITGGVHYDVTAPGLSTPATYWAGFDFYPNCAGPPCPISSIQSAFAAFQVVGTTTPATDWAVLSVSLSPSAPQVGDQVAFSMVMTALTSSAPFPQSFSAVCEIDGASCGGGSLTYPGPAGTPFTVSTQTPWIATPGKHSLAWGVATIPVGHDPNTSNNVMSKSFTVAPQAQFDFSISASPTQQSVVPGGSTSYAVTVDLVSGTAQSVALSLSTPPPAGVSVSFTPTSGTPPFSSTLSVTTAASSSPGTITLTISGIGGGASHSAPVTLIVSQAPDFQISVSPAFQSVLQGQTVSYSVNVAALNGFNSQVSLTVTGAPSGANAVFSVPSATPNFVSTLTVALPASAPTGSFTLAITGSGGGVSHLANAVLIINQATQTQSSSSSSIQTSSSSGASDLVTMLQQNYLLILAAIVLIALLAFATSRRRKPSGPAQATQEPKSGTIYCKSCGTQNPTANEFCAHCGTKL